MTRIKRPAAAGVAVLLALSVAACGGPPTDASKTEFCAAISDLSWAEGLGEDPSGDEIVDALQEFADRLAEVGTPEDIPDDAREGFEITIDTLDDLDPDDYDDADLDTFEDEWSGEDEKLVEALDAYKEETCVTELPEGLE